MKQGKSLTQLAQEIERQQQSKVDLIADTRKLSIEPQIIAAAAEGEKPRIVPMLRMQNGEEHLFPIGDTAHRQIGERVGIPAKYYDRMLAESPQLLASNVNHWFKEQPEKRLVRTLDGRARAFLSNRYQRIDNVHVAETVLPILSGTSGIEIRSCEITERKLYIKASVTRSCAEIKSKRLGDIVEAGIMISNSEIGYGAVSITPFFYFLACLNGMTRQKNGMRSAHLGTRHDGDENLAEILADDTRKTLDRGILLKVRDVVKAALDEVKFRETIGLMQEQAGQIITGNPAASIQVLGQELGLGESEQGSVLRHLIEGGDLSRYGLMNAVTRTAADQDSYDRASEFEAMGGRILDLPAANWSRIAQAA